MPAPRDLVLGQGVSPAEDELRLPRPPGVIRRFWSRHPLTADIVIASIALLASAPALSFRAPRTDQLDDAALIALVVLSVAGCVALLWRRRWPVWVFTIALAPAVLAPPDLAGVLGGPASVIGLYSIAVYRGVRACWYCFGAACILLATTGLVRIFFASGLSGSQIDVNVSMAFILLLGALVGVNVGNRRRYLAALIDRSRQLIVERDQQAQLSAAAERTRIAREMHDIVSHSLTVVVALAEGASATSDAERAREATRAVAATAREALAEMRTMLGVLRTDDEDSAPPRSPLFGTTVHDVVASARSAGLPLELTVSGDAQTASTAHRLAVLRLVQEGITNAMRYSRDGQYVRVHTDYGPAMTRVTIENDGAIVDAASVGTGSGLDGLRERVSALGGDLSAGMVAPGVWRLTASLPGGEG